MSNGPGLEQGERLFNAGRYFEAHEAFEEAWRSAAGEKKLACQALAQLAAAFHKLAQHGAAARGAAYLLERSREKLASAGGALPLGAAPRAVALIDAALAELAAQRVPAAPRLRLEA